MKRTSSRRLSLAVAALALAVACVGIGTATFMLASRGEAPPLATASSPEPSPSPAGVVPTASIAGTPVTLAHATTPPATADLGHSYLVAEPAAVTAGTLSAITYTAAFESLGQPTTVEASLALPAALAVVAHTPGTVYDPASGTLAFRAVVLPGTPITWTVATFSDPLADAPLTARLRSRGPEPPEIEVATSVALLEPGMIPPQAARVESARLERGEVARIVAAGEALERALRSARFETLLSGCPLPPAPDWMARAAALAARLEAAGGVAPARLALLERGVVRLHLAARDGAEVATLWLARNGSDWQLCDLEPAAR